MKALRYVVLALGIGVAGAAVAGPGKLVVTGDILNLRSEPGWWGEITGMAKPGSSVDILARSGGWVWVRHETGSIGWMEANRLAAPVKRIAPTAASRPTAKPVAKPVEGGAYLSVVYTDGNLNLRKGPGTEHAVVAPMSRGSWVEVSERAGPWVKLRHESGAEGWAYGQYLTR